MRQGVNGQHPSCPAKAVKLLRGLRKLVCAAGHPRPCGSAPNKTWMSGTSSATTRFALLPGQDGYFTGTCCAFASAAVFEAAHRRAQAGARYDRTQMVDPCV